MAHRVRIAGLVLASLAVLGATRLPYPEPPRSDEIDDYHGVKVPDPYRPLEDPDAPGTRAWIAAENRITRDYLSTVPAREAVRKRLTELADIERDGPPVHRGKRYFFERNDGHRVRPVLTVTEGRAGAPRTLLDPNGIGPGGAGAPVRWAVSGDGKWIAYGVPAADPELESWRLRRVADGKDLAETIVAARSSGVALSRDGKRLYFVGAGGPRPRLLLHEAGTPPSRDVAIWEPPGEPAPPIEPRVTDDGRWLLVSLRQGPEGSSRLWLREIGRSDAPFRRLLDGPEARESLVGNVGSTFYVLTDRGAPRGRVVAVDVAGPSPMREIVPEGEGFLEDALLSGDRLVLRVRQDASDLLRLHRRDGTFEREIPLPTLGTVARLEGAAGDDELFFSFTSFAVPTTIHRCDVAKGTVEVTRRPAVPFDPAAWEVQRVFYPSGDGTRIPLFLVTKKGRHATGEAPTLLRGYGGFGVAMTPSFSPETVVWLETGGILAQACVRGGGEYGEAWHRAGMRETKQNGVDDFAAAARWMARSGYTNASRIALAGASNGGLLVAATLNQHPELAGAAVVSVGVLDLLRFPRFSIGRAWVPEYGSPDVAEEFGWLRAISPLHNVRTGARYPPVLIVTADRDDRVAPAHSLKYAAALQAAQEGDAPILLRVETREGNPAARPAAAQIDETTDVFMFLSRTLGGLAAPGQRPPRS